MRPIQPNSLHFLLACLCTSLLCIGATPSWAASKSAVTNVNRPTFTLAAPRGDWSVIAYGDMRFTDPANKTATNPQARRALVARIAQEKPDMVLLSGDVPLSGGNPKDYAVYSQETTAWRTQHLHVYPALGNHELNDGDKVENWWNAFPDLHGRRYYSVRFGDVYLITLDSNMSLREGRPQNLWLAGQLKAIPKTTKYIFVSLHHPPVADPVAFNPEHDVRENEKALGTQLESFANQASAKIIVVAGHIHAYERFNHGGVLYIVSGGGGAAQHFIWRTPSDLYQGNVFPNYHYVKFTYRNGVLSGTMYHLDEHGGFQVRDTFVVGDAQQAVAQGQSPWGTRFLKRVAGTGLFACEKMPWLKSLCGD